MTKSNNQIIITIRDEEGNRKDFVLLAGALDINQVEDIKVKPTVKAVAPMPKVETFVPRTAQQATDAQKKAIYSISNKLGWIPAKLEMLTRDKFHKSVEQLNRSQASNIIQILLDIHREKVPV